MPGERIWSWFGLDIWSFRQQCPFCIKWPFSHAPLAVPLWSCPFGHSPLAMPLWSDAPLAMPLWSDAPLALPLWLCPFGHAPLGHAPLSHAPLNLHRFFFIVKSIDWKKLSPWRYYWALFRAKKTPSVNYVFLAAKSRNCHSGLHH